MGRRVAQTPDEPHCFRQILHLSRRRIDGCLEHDPPNEGNELLHMRRELGVIFRVLLGEPCDLLDHARFVRPENEAFAALERLERRRHRDHLDSVLEEFEIHHDLGLQHAHPIGSDGDLEPRPDLTRDGGTADERLALDDDDLLSRLGQIAGAYKTVVPRADYGRVIRLHGDLPR